MDSSRPFKYFHEQAACRKRKIEIVLRWPNTAFARALAGAIQHVHKDCKNKHAVDTAII